MISHKTQVTTNAVDHPHLTSYLSKEPSGRRRAEIVKRLAEQAAMAEAMGGLLAQILDKLGQLPEKMKSSMPAAVEKIDDLNVNSELYNNLLFPVMMSHTEHEIDDASADG